MSRYVQVRGMDREWYVLDSKSVREPKIICYCHGFGAVYEAELIARALNEYHDGLYAKFEAIKQSS